MRRTALSSLERNVASNEGDAEDQISFLGYLKVPSDKAKDALKSIAFVVYTV